MIYNYLMLTELLFNYTDCWIFSPQFPYFRILYEHRIFIWHEAILLYLRKI